ncbi:MAG: HD domain-containing protein [Alphaproteobacteria bacterium]|uniref:HD domain-containing protein n=1 Tax=Candidatus Nitrobium versatile TaxID=2884831 RepID=A0A953M3H3_9BACT|nr:HD domain-containing protein [Candidatus Nitrobium versatile]
MIRKGLIERLFEAASILRWNDHVRPVELTELDKQSHKMVIAYVLAKFEEADREVSVDWIRLIEGGIFEFLHRVILTDIKPPVFHRMMATKGKELNEWVLRQLDKDIQGIKGDFKEKFRRYLFDSDYAKFEKRILKAAHYLATNWEFKIIYNVCPFIYGIEKTKEEIENQIEDHYDLIGVQKITLGKKSHGFIDLCGQLRFQQRWAQSPRIPRTSVLGHMLIVAMFAYFCSMEIGACPRRTYNNFFAALFHDLPEVLTRDIVSPIKGSIEGLQEIIREYEKIQVEEKLLPLLPASWREEIRYFTENEFETKVKKEEEGILRVSSDEINLRYNDDAFCPLDGELIKSCDHLAAFIEASLSIKHGVKARPLVEGKESLYGIYKTRVTAGFDFGQIFDYFIDT